MSPAATFRIDPRGPYELARSRDFLCGFQPANGTCEVSDAQVVRLAFRADRAFDAVGVELRARGASIECTAHGAAEVDALRAQTARIFCLDHDATGFVAVGERDPHIATLLQTYPGFRPVCFSSPYEAAVWGVLASRTSMRQAASARRRLSVEHGDVVDVGGVEIPVVPAPVSMLAIEAASYVGEEKMRRLRAVAEAALDGKLDVDQLRATEPARALEELQSIRGIGPWSASHVLIRGAATPDLLPLGEPRLHHAVAHVRGGSVPDDRELERIADAWRPFRTWVAILVTMHLHRTGKWNVGGRRGAPRAR